ncbi:Uncharacterized protein HZ326_2637 [Fusarium oxysporum f. sp. albedinis]|nr:Uncharacterized protein HZ326_2637 [Fusarium oxysporum f. sp. albedinis]
MSTTLALDCHLLIVQGLSFHPRFESLVAKSCSQSLDRGMHSRFLPVQIMNDSDSDSDSVERKRCRGIFGIFFYQSFCASPTVASAATKRCPIMHLAADARLQVRL